MKRLDLRIFLSLVAIIAGLGGVALSFQEKQANTERYIAGITAVTGYRSTLTSSITGTDATVNVASINDRGGNAISASTIGNRIFFTLEPGTTREEIIMCTGRSGTSWVGCSRGLSFQGRDLSASTTLQYAHNAGVPLVMSNVHFFYEELVEKSTSSEYEEYLGGTYVYTSSSPIFFGQNATGLNCATSFRDGSATSALPRLCFDNSNNYWVAYDDGVNSYRLASTTNITGGRGLLLTGSVLDLATTTTRYPGLAFYTEASVARLGIATSTDISGWGISASSTGMYIAASTTFYSGLRFAAVTGLEFSGQVTSLNINQYISASSTSATSTFRLLENIERLVTPNIQSAATSTSATTTLTGNLVVSGNINHTGAFLGATAVDIGTFTRDLTVADATVAYSHTLGQTPSLIEITCASSQGDTFRLSNGRATSVSDEFTIVSVKDADAGVAGDFVDSTNIISIPLDGSALSGEVGNLTVVSSTGFDIAYTQTSAVTDTINCGYVLVR